MSDEVSGAKAPIKIKKYANRRLYNTATSSYVTLDHLCQMVKDGVDFAVFDAKSGEDITRSVLTQIIVEEEAKGQNLLPIGFLRQLISFYGDNMQQMLLPKYLDFSMKSFSENQEKMRHYMEDTFGSVFPFGQFEEMSKQNLAMFERTMQLFSPRGEGENGAENAQPGTSSGGGDAAKAASDIEALQKQIDAMQQQLKKIGEKSS
ncbi:polyhydroxyalkanoate synthesis repressor PhaR [Hwanghaeella sp.]|uniref:polyhydroxyalkanoate synthesis repressor PhaR n=1 Tax=Hwanghaeella sp. TaxID=2605943 RepID=UPI003CCC089E